MKLLGMDAHQLHVIERGAGCGADPSAQQSDLAEVSATPEIGEHQIAARMRLRHLDEPQPHQVEAVRDIALAANDVALGVAHQLHFIAQDVDEVLRQRREHGHAAQMVVERALAIVGVQLRLEGLVALDDVEHVAQHLKHHAIGSRAHRGRARIQAHAGHLAEQVAWNQRSDRMIVGQIHRSVDRDGVATLFL